MDERDLTTKHEAWDAGIRSNRRGYERGKAEGRREMALELAEWHDRKAIEAQHSADGFAATCKDSMRGYLALRDEHEDSAAECRRRAGE